MTKETFNLPEFDQALAAKDAEIEDLRRQLAEAQKLINEDTELISKALISADRKAQREQLEWVRDNLLLTTPWTKDGTLDLNVLQRNLDAKFDRIASRLKEMDSE